MLEGMKIFKILAFSQKDFSNGTAPDYTPVCNVIYCTNLHEPYVSSNSGLLQIPLSKKFWGERTYYMLRPALWNVQRYPTGAEELNFSSILYSAI